MAADPTRARLSHGLLAAFAALAAAVALPGCGGSDDTPAASPPSAASPAPAPAPAAVVRTSLNAAGSNVNLIEARTSQSVTVGSLPATVFDDFRLSSATSVSSVAWQGIYCKEVANAPAPAPTATQFTITFYADSAGRPNLSAPIASTTVTAAAANETLERTVANLNCGTTPTTWSLYDYRATLAAPVTLAANTTYWISVQAATPTLAVYWGWRAGSVDNSLALQLFNGAYDVLAYDRAYSLLP